MGFTNIRRAAIEPNNLLDKTFPVWADDDLGGAPKEIFGERRGTKADEAAPGARIAVDEEARVPLKIRRARRAMV